MPLPAGYEIESSGSNLPAGYQMESTDTRSKRPIYTPQGELKKETDKMSGTQKFLTGVGAGMYDLYKGGQQAAATLGNKLGVVKPETVQRITEEGQETRNILAPLYEKSTTAKVGQFVGQTAPLMVLPGGVGGNALKRAGTAALAGAGIGATQFVSPGESRIQNVLTGAAGGAAGSGLVSAGGKAVNAFTNKVIPNAIQKLANQFKIPVTLGESTGSAALQKTETLLERAPSFLGLSGYRKKQSEAATNAAKTFLGKFIADPAAGDIEQGNRDFAGKIFEEVKDLVKDVPVQEIQPTQTKQIAKGLLSRYPDIFKKLQDTKTESVINDIINGVTEKPTKTVGGGGVYGAEQSAINKTGGLFSPVNSKIPTMTGGARLSGGMVRNVDFATGKEVPKTISFDEAWTLRQGLGDKIGQARKLLMRGEIDKTAYGQLKQLFGAVSNDLDEWSNKIGKPEIMGKFREANDAYRQYVVKYDIIQRAYDKASGTVGSGEMFSPKKFSTSLESIARKDKALKNFSPQEQAEMTGLANIMQVVKRAGQYAENPPTGNRWGAVGIVASLLETGALKYGGTGAAGSAVVGGAAIGAAKAASVAALVAGTMKVMTTTEAGKRLALAASRVEPNSPTMAKIMTQIMNQVPKMAAVESSQPSKAATSPQWQTIGEDEPEPRADGGPVVPGKTYLTGEQAPELLLNSDGTQQVVGQQGPQVITPQQPGQVLPADVLNQVLEEYKGLAKVHNSDNTQVIFADPERTQKAHQMMGQVGLEYWPSTESGTKDWAHPSKGKNVLEIYADDLKNNPDKLKQAVYGDLMHGMVNDPYYAKLRDEFKNNFTPQEKRRILARKSWWEDANNGKVNSTAATDAYIRGWLGSDSDSAREGQKKSGGSMYSKKQLEILKKMENYIKTGADGEQ